MHVCIHVLHLFVTVAKQNIVSWKQIGLHFYKLAVEQLQAINRMAAGDDNLPRDAKTIIAMLKSMGVDSYEPSVVHQFLEIYYRNAMDLLMDAKTYSNHAGKARVDYADVMLAIKSKSYFSFTPPPLPVVS